MREKASGAPRFQQVTLEVDSVDADADGYEPVWNEGERIGYITSGEYGHAVDKSLAMALVQPEMASPGTELSTHIVGVEVPSASHRTIPLRPVGLSNAGLMIIHHHEGWVSATDVEASLGWVLKPEGLCKGEVCVPVQGHPALVRIDKLHLETLAKLLGMPLVVLDDPEVGYLGPESNSYATELGELIAPDFSLPDLDGRVHSLSEHRGSKVLLAAWASW